MRTSQTITLALALSALRVHAQTQTQATARPAAEEADKCYDESGRAVHCVADFVNAAFGQPMLVSSQCGSSGREQVCRVMRDRNSVPQRLCSQCDATSARLSHGPRWLTDLHNPNNATCWISHKLKQNDENVTLELALRKKYEVTYVSVQLCSTRPDTVSIYKSADNGRSWIPFQFYSTQCRKMFSRSPRTIARRCNEQEVLCSQFAQGDDAAASRISFSTLEGRPSAYAVEESPILQDWMTATNIRIVMMRLKTPVDSLTPTSSPENDHGPDSMIYAVADVAVGGRCKCNGHAAKCGMSTSGVWRQVCDCRHNTMGDDCEKCRPLFQDVPWARGTIKNAHECKKCNCNMHSQQCRFNKDVYLQSGMESGGVCLKCKHHTAGRHCHFCAEGYYRDWTKPMAHRKACRECECHPIGAADSLCNQTTGTCRCKPGVTGTACDRCMAGHQQSRSPTTPCVRLRSAAGNDRESSPPAHCADCPANQKYTITKYCEADFVIQATLAAEEEVGDWKRLTMEVQKVIKRVGTKVKRGSVQFWARIADLACDCPKLRLQKQYIILSQEVTQPKLRGLVLTRKSVVVPWNDSYSETLRRLQQEERNGTCSEQLPKLRLL